MAVTMCRKVSVPVDPLVHSTVRLHFLADAQRAPIVDAQGAHLTHKVAQQLTWHPATQMKWKMKRTYVSEHQAASLQLAARLMPTVRGPRLTHRPYWSLLGLLCRLQMSTMIRKTQPESESLDPPSLHPLAPCSAPSPSIHSPWDTWDFYKM